MSAKRAHEIGLVSEVVPAGQLREAAEWAANAIASAPPLAIQGTLRAIWAARELTRQQAIGLGYAFIGLGTSQESIRQGQEFFASGKRIKWKLR
jgi:enoyl-CoA hydratase/carnithine racemase